MTGKTSGDGARTNSKGESHCFNCGSPSHWAYECPQLSREQQAQLHMNQEAQEDTTEEQAGKEGHQMMHISFSQGGELPDDRAYLDGCSTVTAFKNKKFLENLRQVKGGIKINCNAGAVTTDIKGDFGGLSLVPAGRNCEYLFDARAREAVQDHVRQLGGFLCGTHSTR